MDNLFLCEIRANNAAANDPCAFCGGRTDPHIPLAIFKRGTYEPVCDKCAEEHAPNEFSALNYIIQHYKNGRIISKKHIDMSGFEDILNGVNVEALKSDSYMPFIPAGQGYYLETLEDGTKHALIGFRVLNTAGMPGAVMHIEPVVAWSGDMSKCAIFKDKKPWEDQRD